MIERTTAMTVPEEERKMKTAAGIKDEAEAKKILTEVYESLVENGYNPLNQLVGYLLSEDPTYITGYNKARSLIRKIDRDELLKNMLKNYLGV